MKKFNNLLSIIMIVVSLILAVGLFGCDNEEPDRPYEIQANNLMHGITARSVNTVALDEKFLNSAAKFSLDLFKATISDTDNSLISPASVLLALAMTANGADGNTLTQMEQVIGGGMPMIQLNAYLYSFLNSLTSNPKTYIRISNSIWFRENGFTPNRDFLQTNADYYGADAYAAPFDDQTVSDINAWINQATDGLIKKMLEEIPEEAVMYLINTILFDAEWMNIYDEYSTRKGEFTNYKNQKQTADFMHSMENIFIQDDDATGFIKPYHSGHYSFAAILPNNDIDIFDFAASLSGEKYLNLIKNKSNDLVKAALPKFDYDYEILMNDALKAMGMKDAFDETKADLTRIGESVLGRLFISNVMHKATITVDERGTKAGAATVVEVGGESAPEIQYFVILDRPFVYAIIDNETNLPLFIGTLLSIP